MNADLGKLLLRLSVAGMLLVHGVSKLRGGVGPISSHLHEKGLPEVLAYGVYLGEVIAPLLVLIGYSTRLGAWLMAFNMLVAIWLVHGGDLFHLNRTGGYALELQMLYLIGSISIALLGAGRYSASKGEPWS